MTKKQRLYVVAAGIFALLYGLAVLDDGWVVGTLTMAVTIFLFGLVMLALNWADRGK